VVDLREHHSPQSQHRKRLLAVDSLQIQEKIRKRNTTKPVENQKQNQKMKPKVV
jgi:hypothetical protein